MTANGSSDPAVAGVAVSAEDLQLSFFTGRQRVDVLHGASLWVEPGERIALMGPSGAGKSSLLYCLAGLLQPQAGTVRVDGLDLVGLSEGELAAYRLGIVGIVYQGFHLIGALDATANVALPMILAGTRRRVATARALDLLDQVGLAARSGHRPAQLSGGEQQRVAIARALANEPRLLLADEPTGNLDAESTEQVLDLLAAVTDRRRTLVVATHDEQVAARLGRVVRLEAGSLVDRPRALPVAASQGG
jgi:predicted ABC-type transport system involved in lysophospholipase L1 biosynthesis ATPase subunit